MKDPPSDPVEPRLSLPRLRALCAVAEEGSVAAAGRRLGLSHAAVGQHLRELEAQAGGRLFRRSEGRMQPTPLCAELADIALRMEALQSEAQRIMARRSRRGRSMLRVGLGNAMPGVAIIAELIRASPDLEVEVQTGSHKTILASLQRREVDVGVLPNLPVDPHIRRLELLRQEVVAIVAPEHPPVATFTMPALDGLPLIFRAPGSSTQRVVDRAFRDAGLAPVPRLVADTRDAVYEAVSAGIGVGFMWRHGTHRADGARRVPIAGLGPSTQECAFALADDRNPAVDLFLGVARQVALRLAQGLP